MQTQANKSAQQNQEVHGPSVVNLSSGADQGLKLDGSQSIKQLKSKIMGLNKTVFTPKTDPLFFLYLERLSMAEKLKDNKDDRVDGRRALNDFILEHDSIVHTKSVKKAEAQKLQHQRNLKEKGEWKGAKDGNIDPFTDLRKSYKNMVDGKQTLTPTRPKEIGKELEQNDAMKQKNLINLVKTTNRSPKNQQSQQQLSPNFSQDHILSMGELNSPEHSQGHSMSQFKLGNATLQRQPSENEKLMSFTGSNQRLVAEGRNLAILAGSSVDGPHTNTQSHVSFDHKQGGRTSMSLPKDSKLAGRVQELTDSKGHISEVTGQLGANTLGDTKGRSLVSKLVIPAANPKEAKLFKLYKSHHLDERSPLNSQRPEQMDCRMPTIFQKQKNQDDDDDANSIQKINQSIKSSDGDNAIDEIQRLVDQGGSSAYLLYLQQQDAEKRKSLKEQNGGVFETNQYLVANREHGSYTQIMVPKKFQHSESINNQKMIPQEIQDLLMEEQIHQMVNSTSLMPQYDLTPAVRGSSFNYAIKHKGDTMLKQRERDDLNIFNRLQKKMLHDRKSQVRQLTHENQFGLGESFIQKRKASVQPQGSSGLSLNPNSSLIKDSKNDNLQIPEWLDERYVVIFVEDGSTLETCRSFKFNVQEILHKYELKRPRDPRITIPREEIQVNLKFQKRAYKELLEFCGDHFKKYEHEAGIPYKMMYSLDGQKLETITDLKNFCLLEGSRRGEGSQLKHHNQIKLNDSSNQLSARSMTMVKKDIVSEIKNKVNKASFVISPGTQLPQGMDKKLSVIPQTHVEISDQSSMDETNFLSGQDSPHSPTAKALNAKIASAMSKQNLPSIYKDEDKNDLLYQSNYIENNQVERGPRIILLSTKKDDFIGIKLQAGDNKRLLREGNYKHVRQTLDQLNAKKGNELYLQWLDRNHGKIDPSNYKMFLNMQAHDQALNYSNEESRLKTRHVLNQRRYTSNTTLQPPYIGGGMADCKEFLLPQLHSIQSNQQTQLRGKWKDEAMLKALDNIKRDEIFKALRHANSQTLTKNKLAMLTQSPIGKRAQVLANKNYSSRNEASPLHLQTTEPRHSSVKPMMSPQVPSLKQLRMIQLQQQILNKTQAGIKAHIVDGASASRNNQPSLSQLSSAHNLIRSPKVDTENTLSYDEVKALSDEYHISCKNIYELHAEFNSMREIAIQQLEFELKDIRDSETQEQTQTIISESKTQGIPLNFFTKNSALMNDKHREIQEPIFEALGILVQNTKMNHYISWGLFLRMNALLNYHCATKQEQIEFWVKFFNPIGSKLINRQKFIDKVELLTRGRFTDKKTLISEKFANGIYLMLMAKGCTSRKEKDFGEIKASKLKSKLSSDAFSVDYFNQMLKKDCEYQVDEELIKQANEAKE